MFKYFLPIVAVMSFSCAMSMQKIDNTQKKLNELMERQSVVQQEIKRDEQLIKEYQLEADQAYAYELSYVDSRAKETARKIKEDAQKMRTTLTAELSNLKKIAKNIEQEINQLCNPKYVLVVKDEPKQNNVVEKQKPNQQKPSLWQRFKTPLISGMGIMGSAVLLGLLYYFFSDDATQAPAAATPVNSNPNNDVIIDMPSEE